MLIKAYTNENIVLTTDILNITDQNTMKVKIFFPNKEEISKFREKDILRVKFLREINVRADLNEAGLINSKRNL